MQRKAFGALAATLVTQILAQSPALAKDAKPKTTPVAAGKCAHNCSGYATCKGNGNNSCKGKNDCANTGLVPKECSTQKTDEACTKVVDAKKNQMCSWFPG